jgi:hypothetical protein
VKTDYFKLGMLESAILNTSGRDRPNTIVTNYVRITENHEFDRSRVSVSEGASDRGAEVVFGDEESGVGDPTGVTEE